MLDSSFYRALWVLSALGWLPQPRAVILQPTSIVPDSTTSAELAQHTTRMAPRWAGKVNPAVLFRRAPTTCGYQLADSRYPMTCPEGDTCVFDNSLYWGPYCCSKDSSGKLESGCASAKITACLDYGEANGNSVSFQTTYNHSLYCPSSYQYCSTVLLTISTISSLNGLYTSYGCNINSGEIYNAERTASPDVTVTTGATTKSSAASTSSPTPAASEDTGTATSTSVKSTRSTSSSSPVTFSVPNETTLPATTSTDPPVTGSAEPDKSNAAAIGGGVGGGVGGALAIAGVVGYLIHRKRKQRREKVPEVAN